MEKLSNIKLIIQKQKIDKFIKLVKPDDGKIFRLFFDRKDFETGNVTNNEFFDKIITILDNKKDIKDNVVLDVKNLYYTQHNSKINEQKIFYKVNMIYLNDEKPTFKTDMEKIAEEKSVNFN